MIILYFALVFAAGLILGSFASSFATVKRLKAGSIVVNKTDEKMTYTLVMDGDPERLQYEDYVLFNVVAMEDSPDYRE